MCHVGQEVVISPSTLITIPPFPFWLVARPGCPEGRLLVGSRGGFLARLPLHKRRRTSTSTSGMPGPSRRLPLPVPWSAHRKTAQSLMLHHVKPQPAQALHGFSNIPQCVDCSMDGRLLVTSHNGFGGNGCEVGVKISPPRSWGVCPASQELNAVPVDPCSLDVRVPPLIPPCILNVGTNSGNPSV